MPLLTYTNDFAALIGQPEDWNKAQTSFNEIRAILNALDDSNFVAGSGFYTMYRTLTEAQSRSPSAATVGDYLFTQTGVAIIETGVVVGPHSFYVASADYAITGRTPKLRVRAQCHTNATAPAITLTVGLYPITASAGGSDQNVITLGSVVAGSTVAFASPGASASNQGNSGDFSLPADGHYALGVALSGTQATNASVSLAAQLQLHYV